MIKLLLEILLALVTVINVKAMGNSEADIIAPATEVNNCIGANNSIEANNTTEANNSTSVDMGVLGTFSTEYPFNYPRFERIYSPRPDKREKINTKFHFFSRSNKNIPKEVFNMICNMSLFSWNVNSSGFYRGLDTYIIIHDLRGETSAWQLKLKNALLNNSDCNVFIVNWSDGYGELYEQSVANIRVVGAEVGLFMQRLVNIFNLDPKFLHIIGHGLGAHGAGYAGKWFQERQNKLIGRITGLDPAGPYFNGVNKIVRLDKGDAAFVDVIHTNTEGENIYGFGLKEPIGHVDFYPNGGEKQSHCVNITAEYKLDKMSYSNSVALFLNFTYGEENLNPVDVNPGELNCSHYRACDYFIATLEEPDCKFESLSCYSYDSYFQGGCGSCDNNACIRMGFYAYTDACELQNTRPLKLFVKTKLSSPYCYAELPNVLNDVFTIYKEHLLIAYRLTKH